MEEQTTEKNTASNLETTVSSPTQLQNDSTAELADKIECKYFESNPEFSVKLHNLLSDANFIKLRKTREVPNLFNIVGRTHTENWHSSFLAWLLNPNGSHNLNYFPLRCILNKMYSLSVEQKTVDPEKLLPTPELIDTGFFDETVIQPESHGAMEVGERSVYYEKMKQWCSFDIALSAKIKPRDGQPYRFVFICENKMESHEGKSKFDEKIRQTEMYANFWYKGSDNQAFFPINTSDASSRKNTFYGQKKSPKLALLFLSAQGEKAKDHKFVNMNYKELYHAVLLPSLQNPDISSTGKQYIREYINLLDMKKYIRSNDSEELLEEIFKSHASLFKDV